MLVQYRYWADTESFEIDTPYTWDSCDHLDYCKCSHSVWIVPGTLEDEK